MTTIPQRYRRTDRRTTRLRNTALRVPSRGKKLSARNNDGSIQQAVSQHPIGKWERTSKRRLANMDESRQPNQRHLPTDVCTTRYFYGVRPVGDVATLLFGRLTCPPVTMTDTVFLSDVRLQPAAALPCRSPVWLTCRLQRQLMVRLRVALREMSTANRVVVSPGITAAAAEQQQQFDVQRYRYRRRWHCHQFFYVLERNITVFCRAVTSHCRAVQSFFARIDRRTDVLGFLQVT